MTTKRILFLDDRSKRIHAALKKYAPPEYDLTIVCTVKECIKMISNEPRWDIVSLDHDLNFEEFVDSDRKDCGMEVVRWIEKHASQIVRERKWPNNIIIHTSNNIIGEYMVDVIFNVMATLKITMPLPRHERFEYDD